MAVVPSPGDAGHPLQSLPPWVKIATGAITTCLCAAMAGMGSLVWITGSFVGVPLLTEGVRDARRRAAERLELARARAELDAIRPGVHEAVRRRRDVGELLRRLGYTTSKARRWIALECDVVLPRDER